MKILTTVVCVALLVAIPATPQAGAAKNAPNFDIPSTTNPVHRIEVPGQLLPSSQTDPFSCAAPNNIATCPTRFTGVDVWLETASFVNNSGSNCQVQIYDQQSTPRLIFQGLIPAYDASIPAANNFVIQWQARYAKGGVKWSACDATSITGYIRGMRL